ncbi:flagellar hook-length control protein FliK [Marinomonas atlantica]|uniref:flagellar hook-length control protein FliK n=1 Tax=Marinomonas atlantica TaxID=1806668 RepID=UPI000836B908|nr:flagellar hook-length control protein FliK [Marinomonas atlantica]MCO4785850.1 flagellar hook-length control protein FliK [Marinomonas atlantica]
MITDINSLVSGAGKPASSQSSATSSIGTIAKLNSELKLIEGMQSVQITSVKNAQTASGNSQLIGVTRNNQQQLTLINDKPSPNLHAGDKGTINVTGNQVTLMVNVATKDSSTYNQTPTSNSPHSTQTSPSSSTSTSSNTQQNSAPTQQTLTAKPSPPATTYQAANSSAIQQAKTVAQVAIASRPITLTVISSNAELAQPSGANNAMTDKAPSISVQNAPTATVKNTTTSPINSIAPASIQNATQLQTSSLNSPQVNYSAIVSDGEEQFTLTTKHPLKPGDTLNVIVDKQGQLQLYPTERTNTTAATLTEGLKQTLPKQVTPQEFISLIRQLSTLSQAQNTTALPEKLSSAIDQLIKQLPNIQSLTQSGDGIKQAIQNSGLFSENNLAKQANLVSDLKLNLSRLEGVNNELSKVAPTTNNLSINSPQQALSMVAGAIERITTSQVRHLIESAQQDGSILPLTVEIPIKDGQSTSIVNLRIDKDDSDNETQEPHKRRWLVQLKFEFEETGRFEARASVQDKKVGVLFAVEEANTEQMIRERLDDLRANLRGRDVEIETLDCFRAKLNAQPNQYQETSHKRLIDVRT